MPLPEVYARENENVLSSFDYFDIADGTGVEKFWLFASELTGGIDYHLNSEIVYSSLIDTQAVIPIGASAKLIDLDFDLTAFNLPRAIRGTAIFQITLKVDSSTGTAVTSGFIIARIRKGDDTEIASAQSQTIAPANNTNEWAILNIPIVIPKTGFKKGETLRLTIEAWGAATNAAGTIFIGHDPRNRDSEDVADPEGIRPSVDNPVSINSSHIFMPFAIDL